MELASHYCHQLGCLKIMLVSTVLVASSACTGDFEDINRNPYHVTAEEMKRDGYNVGASLVGLQSFVIPVDLHLNQFQECLAGCAFAGYMASTPEWTARFATYNAPVDWNRAPFNDLITGIYPYREQLHSISDDPTILALGELFRIASMHRVTDTYGPIPYSRMTGSGLTSAYDSQKDAYNFMLQGLNDLIETLYDNRFNDASYYAKYDNVYGGDLEKWIKFANSLKLRMAMRIVYVDPERARQEAESAIAHPIGVMTTNADNALLKVTTNPIYTQVYEWQDERVGADIACYMNGYNDPRRAAYFTVSGFAGNPYAGLRSGIDVASKSATDAFSAPIVGVTDPIMWMNAAEVSFLRAEGALRGWNMGGGSAQEWYNNGITLSFGQYGIAGAEAFLNDDTSTPSNFTDPLGNSGHNFSALSTIKIKWNGAAGLEENLERIITQKWIANFPLGMESWAEFRRTGYPRLALVVQNKSGGTVPPGTYIRRLPFPDTEYQENRDNVRDAVGMLGGSDTQGTKLWWDKK
ncbi:MAG: SusD/RagB family nutrient-binding outer membrane lipoprotein [Dysgonamonadaceae bacterium]|nr:SusD/RagB family nutrient-binding outer membrane lipoprotein [Dysgonamonadaceae bacterium]